MRLSDQHFTTPYTRPAYDLPLADFDPRCIECGKWPTDCECNFIEPEEEETH